MNSLLDGVMLLCTMATYTCDTCMVVTCQEEDRPPVEGPTYTALYDFKGQDATQLDLTKGEMVCHVIDMCLSRIYPRKQGGRGT